MHSASSSLSLYKRLFVTVQQNPLGTTKKGILSFKIFIKQWTDFLPEVYEANCVVIVLMNSDCVLLILTYCTNNL